MPGASLLAAKYQKVEGVIAIFSAAWTSCGICSNQISNQSLLKGVGAARCEAILSAPSQSSVNVGRALYLQVI